MAKVAKKKADRGIGAPIGTQMDVFPFSPSGWFRMDCNSATLAGRSLVTLWTMDIPHAKNPAKKIRVRLVRVVRMPVLLFDPNF